MKSTIQHNSKDSHEGVFQHIQQVLSRLGVPAVVYTRDGRCISSTILEAGGLGAACAEPKPRLCSRIMHGHDLNAEMVRSLRQRPSAQCENILAVANDDLLMFCCAADANGPGRRVIQGLINALLQEKLANKALASDFDVMTSSLAQSYEELALMHKITDHMRFTQHPKNFLNWLCNDLREVIQADKVFVLWLPKGQPKDESKFVCSGDGQIDKAFSRLLWQRGEEAIKHPHGVLNDGTVENGRLCYVWPDWLHNIALAPICQAGQLVGIIAGTNKKNATGFNSFDAKLLVSLANEIAVYLDNFGLYQDLHELLIGSLKALTSSIDAKDPYTCGHSERVARLAKYLAGQFGLSDAEQENIYLTGLLHDVGKIGVSEKVLCKPGRLGADEFEQIKMHPQIGANILGGIRQMADVVRGVLSHHERFDGGGYPNHLHGKDIPLAGRIVMLADCFDAMISDRTYQKAMPIVTAQTEIRRFSGTQFDPELADILLRKKANAIQEDLTAMKNDDPLSQDACLAMMH